ncbi:MAG: succinylglutamate desuccinylase/aspartoacylase family protein, partial [Acidimicrobiia bacterium]|nr:succinylglutamate desuccinylase/aspartoacylase family protein [Acidimicrobiia bacterium]
WVRARSSGVLRLDAQIGDDVAKGDVLGSIGPVGSGKTSRITATVSGRVIGATLDPIIGQGNAIVNIAEPEGA